MVFKAYASKARICSSSTKDATTVDIVKVAVNCPISVIENGSIVKDELAGSMVGVLTFDVIGK